MLLSNLDVLATAPGGVARLRELILTLAVQGKLLPQDPADEPASELLKKIRAEKDRLIAEGKIKRDKPLVGIAEEELPFELPAGWEWVRLGSVTKKITDGTHHSPANFSEGEFKYLSAKNIKSWGIDLSDVTYVPAAIHEEIYARCDPEYGDILYIKDGATTGVLTINTLKEQFSLLSSVGVLKPSCGLTSEYLALVMRSPFFYQAIRDGMTGVAITRVTLSKLAVAVAPLPPLAEQSRIVARVEELMRLCDALEAKGRLEAAHHARLVSTLLATLTDSATPETLAENWQRLATHFDTLLDRPEAVDALEQTILQLAVRGQLVPQDPADEPASALLLRVSQSNAINAGKRRKSTDNELSSVPYDLPNRWTWAQLGELVENMGSGWSPACDEGERSDPTQWAVLRTTAVQVNEYRAREHKVIPLKLSPRPEIEVKNGDILITRAGPMNRVGISCWVDNTPPRLMLSDKIVRFHSVADEMLPAFIVLTLNAGWTKDQIETAKSGMAASQVNISQSDLRGFWIPVCSKAEQSRIVARVESLRRLCADLRQRLSASQTAQAQLAGALVASVA